MAKYEVIWVADNEHRRDYKDRQYYANQLKCDFYIELHFNAFAYDKPGTDDNPCSVIVCDNASPKTRDIAEYLSDLVSEHYHFPNRGVDVVGRDRAGYWNLYYTNMQAVLTELLYVSDKEQVAIIMSDEGMDRIAAMHVATIKKFYPNGAKIALSIGHKFKVSSPYDRGAPVVGTKLGEADLTEILGKRIVKLLAETDEVTEPAERRVEFTGPLTIEVDGDKTVIILPGE